VIKVSVKRLLVAGAACVAMVAAPLSLSLLSVGSGPATLASAASSGSCPASATNDIICYVQSTGSTGTFAQYTPATTSGSGKATSVSLTSGGGCATPSWQSTPLINFTGLVYADGTYGGTPTTAPVDASKQKTGVCGLNGTGTNPWAIDDPASGGAEALDFTIGSNPNMGGARLFSEAAIQIANVSTTATTVTLVETLTGSGQVGSQSCTIPASSAGTTVDTNGNGACVGVTPPSGPFDTIEIQVPQSGHSVSVVGPSSVFYLAKQICGGQSIQSTGTVTAVLSLPGGAGCKTYTSFTSSTDANGTSLLSFNGYSTSPVQFTVQVTWPVVPLCQPYDDAGIPAALALPMCAPHQFSFDNITYYDQAYCVAPVPGALPQQGLCTANKSYANLQADGTPYVAPGGGNGTEVTETWVGDIDWYMR
jgi:hypothetical protein